MKEVQFCLVFWGVVGLVRFLMGGFMGFERKSLLYRMLWIRFISWWYSSCFRLLESTLLNKNLTVAYLLCVGWFEV